MPYSCDCPQCKILFGDYQIPVKYDLPCNCPVCQEFYSPTGDLINDYHRWTYQSPHKEQPTEKAMGKDFSGIYRFNYSTVDEFGFGSEHSIVLNVPSVLPPEDSFHEFVRLISSEIRYHLIEYFLVRWENGEYVRV